jgi:hypothetical protein
LLGEHHTNRKQSSEREKKKTMSDVNSMFSTVAQMIENLRSDDREALSIAVREAQAWLEGQANPGTTKDVYAEQQKAVEAVVAATGCTHETASRAVEFVGSSVEKAVAFVKKQAEQHKAATKVQAAQRGKAARKEQKKDRPKGAVGTLTEPEGAVGTHTEPKGAVGTHTEPKPEAPSSEAASSEAPQLGDIGKE